ncbi:hypothetical protein ATZ33_11740 [Enterococcus silesiacus]|uniref:HTH lacI-type domain-containing protein n=2 Tax=Enterococcus silesiacus TaxID=332949 RepID=A0ABM5WA32_9ENTE|nr:substrate-binding domain-containing protein [Enterococcus silesiacus]ALS02031.1 hypothetical protein ATZ33_11740 [Enterococcus silesiacus]
MVRQIEKSGKKKNAVTIKDIAKIAGVSPATVSIAINDKKARINTQTREKIKQIAQELGYRKNQNASSLVTSKTMNIGVIVPDISNPFFSELAKSLGDYAISYGYNIFIANSYNDFEQEKKHIQSFMEQNVDGLILTSTNPQQLEKQQLTLTMPTLFLDRQGDDHEQLSIGVDDEQGGAMIADLFLQNAHDSICGIVSKNLGNKALKRMKGFISKLGSSGIATTNIPIYEGQDEVNAAKIAAGYIIADKRSAVFAANDLIGLYLIRELLDLGIRIPEDVSVAGFDDIPMTQIFNPRLTTIRQPIEEIGKESIKRLITIINGTATKETAILLPLTLIERDSVINKKGMVKK